MARYWKFIIAFVGACGVLAVALAGDGVFGDYGPAVVAFLTAFGVFFKANEPAGAP